MKKKILVVAVVMLVCAAVMALSGCFLFKKPFETTVNLIKEKGTEVDGQYVYSEYDEEYDTTFKIIYNEANAEQFELQYVDDTEIFSMIITKEKGNYTWTMNDADYGNLSGYVDITKDSEDSAFLIVENYGSTPEEDQKQEQKYLGINANICILSLDLFFLDNDSSISVSKFGFNISY